MKTDINPNVYIEFLIKPHFEYLNSWTFIIGSLKHTKIKLLLILFNCTSITGEINCAWMLDWFCLLRNNTHGFHRVSWKEQDTFCIFPGRVYGGMKFKCWLRDSQVCVSCFNNISLVVNFQNWRCCHLTE